MADPSNGITFRTIQEAMPEYHISDDLVRGVVAAMPPPAAGICHAWRRERLARVVDEVAARVPMDAAQGHLAGQLVVVEFLALEMLERVTTWALPLAERRLASRTSDDLTRSISRLERTLERRQMRVMPFRDVGAAAGFDLDMLDRVWCRGMPAAGAEPVAPPAAPERAAPPAPETPEPVTPPAEGAKAMAGQAMAGQAMAGQAMAGQAMAGRAMAGRPMAGQAMGAGDPAGHDARGRAGVTVEQGDGWSLEHWPAGAGAAVASGAETHDELARPVAAAAPAMAKAPVTKAPGLDRAATDRPGSRRVS